jgi:spore cortex formation protein SpoVR/YcgB (stage V sporulation)
MEKLKYEDGAYIDVVIDRINELIDTVNGLEDRIDNHWSFHRHKFMEEKKAKSEKEKNGRESKEENSKSS